MSFSKIEWCDFTLNILTGCLHGCPYCYARSMTQRFCGNIKWNLAQTGKYRKEGEIYILDEPFLDESGQQVVYPFGFAPTFHKYRFGCLDRMKMGQRVFVGAMADVFGDWVPESVIKDIFRECEDHPKNSYIFLTKNPKRYSELELPDKPNYFYGTSVTCPDDFGRLDLLPKAGMRFVSFEPLLADISAPLLSDIKNGARRGNLDWIIAGAETGRKKGKIVPERSWISAVEEYAEHWDIPIFMKDSLIPIVGKENMKCESPARLLEKPLSDKITAKRTVKCKGCGRIFRKKMMVIVTARAKERGKSTTLSYFCGSCFKNWCIENGFEDPELEAEG
ncbi:MAG: DUF5131 family protein [Lachnospiraceae bacterium]|nr:DUF5131 family protein [Lachnospiraceae bacterium]